MTTFSRLCLRQRCTTADRPNTVWIALCSPWVRAQAESHQASQELRADRFVLRGDLHRSSVRSVTSASSTSLTACKSNGISPWMRAMRLARSSTAPVWPSPPDLVAPCLLLVIRITFHMKRLFSLVWDSGCLIHGHRTAPQR